MSSSPDTAGLPATLPAQCANCGTQLLGPHCYACGQPVKGLVRQFSSILSDFFGTLLALDSRLTRTLGPLVSRPGYLTAEYLAGRRVRYVSPVRLFIFLCLTTFFVVQLSSDWEIRFVDSEIAKAETVEDVQRLRDETLRELQDAREESEENLTALEALKIAETTVRQQAAERIAVLQGQAPPVGLPKQDSEKAELCLVGLSESCWDPRVQPVDIAGLPAAVNDWLTARAIRANDNIKLIKEDPNRFKDAFLGAIPATLFLLLPLFALILWLLYLFQRRLYMEHLIVALHSHAFLCLAVLLVTLLMDIREWLQAYAVVDVLCSWAIGLLCLWMPLYLLLMQKRVYAQGWAMTLTKFLVLGVVYSVLLAFGATLTVLTSLAWM